MSANTDTTITEVVAETFANGAEYGRQVIADVARQIPEVNLTLLQDDFASDALRNTFGARMRRYASRVFPVPSTAPVTIDEATADPVLVSLIKYLTSKDAILMRSLDQVVHELHFRLEQLRSTASQNYEMRMHIADQTIEALGRTASRKDVEEYLNGQGFCDKLVQDITTEVGKKLKPT